MGSACSHPSGSSVDVPLTPALPPPGTVQPHSHRPALMTQLPTVKEESLIPHSSSSGTASYRSVGVLRPPAGSLSVKSRPSLSQNHNPILAPSGVSSEKNTKTTPNGANHPTNPQQRDKRAQAAHTLAVTVKAGSVSESEDELEPLSPVKSLRNDNSNRKASSGTGSVKKGKTSEEVITTTTVTVTATTTAIHRPAARKKVAEQHLNQGGQEATDQQLQDGLGSSRHSIAAMLKDEGEVANSPNGRSSLNQPGDLILSSRASPSPPVGGKKKPIIVVSGKSSTPPKSAATATSSPPPSNSTATSVAQEKAELQQLLLDMRKKTDNWISTLEAKQSFESQEAERQSLQAHRDTVATNRAAVMDQRRRTTEQQLTNLVEERFQNFQTVVEADKAVANLKIDMERTQRRLKAEEERRQKRMNEDRRLAEEEEFGDIDTTGLPTMNAPLIDTSSPPTSSRRSHSPRASSSYTTNGIALMSPTSIMSSASTASSTLSTTGIHLSPPPTHRSRVSISNAMLVTPSHHSTINPLDSSMDFDDHSSGTLSSSTNSTHARISLLADNFASLGVAPAPIGGGGSALRTGKSPSRNTNSSTDDSNDPQHAASRKATAELNALKRAHEGLPPTANTRLIHHRSSSSATVTPFNLQEELATGSSLDAIAKGRLLEQRAAECTDPHVQSVLLSQARLCMQLADVKRLEEASAKRREELFKEQDDFKALIQQAKEAKEAIVISQVNRRRTLEHKPTQPQTIISSA